MARITVTTDEGIIIEGWRDWTGPTQIIDDEIGVLDSRANLSRLIGEIANAVERARHLDGRNSTTGDRA